MRWKISATRRRGRTRNLAGSCQRRLIERGKEEKSRRLREGGKGLENMLGEFFDVERGWRRECDRIGLVFEEMDDCEGGGM